MRILLNQSVFAEDPAELSRALMLLREDSAFLRGSYPNFDSWLFDKVVPGVMCGERTVVIEVRAMEVAGFMILKHSHLEKKLCTLRVRPQYENRGMGVRLFNAAFEILETEFPLLSVSEKAMPKFEPLFEYFGFSQEATYEDRYLPRVRELSYNGLLDGQEPTLNSAHFPSSISQKWSQRPSAPSSTLRQRDQFSNCDKSQLELLTA